ncbi:Huntingtin-interacting protein 1 [Lamellibrachia satsuma]|nr:Huntingtin-interacting protein 1 [Lamellibrachia satsuma]
MAGEDCDALGLLDQHVLKRGCRVNHIPEDECSKDDLSVACSVAVGSGQLFWHAVQHLQLQGHPILCWKFCHVLHKMLRDGHSQVLVDSRRYTGFMTELGKLWGHLRDSYGNLIANYTKLLIGRLAYYSKVQ